MTVSGGLIHFPLAAAAAATPRCVLPRIKHLTPTPTPTHTHIKQRHQRRLRLAVIRSTTNNNNGQTSTSAIEAAAATAEEEELEKEREKTKQGGDGGGGGGDGDGDDGARKEKEGWWLLDGVAEEVRQIQWPQFAKVLGTTGVVLYVIAGSSAVLLTVNALLAELSDRVFAGKGLQDFFSG